MDINEFKDKVFELLNESDLDITDLELEDRYNRLIVSLGDHTNFVVRMYPIDSKIPKWGDTTIENEVSDDIQEYVDTHTREEFLVDIDALVATNPVYYRIYFVLMKLVELGLIDELEVKRISEGIDDNKRG